MADIVLSPVLQVIFDRLASPILQVLGDRWDLKDNFQNLQQALLMAQAVLEEAEDQQVTNKAVKAWLLKLKVAAYDAEDLLDKLAARLKKSDAQEAHVSSFFDAKKIVLEADEVRKKLQELQMVAMEGSNFHFQQGNMVAASQFDEKETGCFVTESEIYGRNKDKEEIVKLLLSREETNKANLSFIPIIGMGGLGKTTLAQLAYNDDEVIFDRLASPILQKAADVWGLKDNFKNLQHALLMAQAVLEDAEDQQGTNKAVRTWLSKLKDAAYHAEDLLDQITARTKMSKTVETDWIFSYFRKTGFEYAERLRLMLQELENTAVEGSKFHLRQGRGLGKTTLAQLAHNDEEVTRYFDVKIWVFVSDDFDVQRIMMAIIESATMDKCDSLAMNVLQSKIWALLHKKRYLIVLDDVWIEDHEEWDKLEPLLRAGIDGVKSLSLPASRAFLQGEEDQYPKLLAIGKEIIKKCGGVPLAAKTLGSLMRFKREEREWLFVQHSELWDLDVYHTGILPA
ncbi:hypothetical protein GH714_030239 [Hevea brasiliensis]|uniref:Rx N-terminal domain-containing protein n=1 Tax=Hevea brasiliensis TaxID=3981 RepID=A0A6A6N815_HEVBR|nr:hypothetical protein GH714_030239 [Hevea brasiliensis]